MLRNYGQEKENEVGFHVGAQMIHCCPDRFIIVFVVVTILCG
jgi:hypothetical protein